MNQTTKLKAIAVEVAATLTELITAYCDRSTQATCQFTVATNNLDQFAILAKAHPDAEFETLYDVAGDFTGSVGRIQTASGDLTAAAAGATVHSVTVNVNGYYQVAFYGASSSGAGSEVDIFLSLSDGILGGGVGKDTNASIAYTPSGSIAATTVNAAIAELDSEKAPKASPTFTGTITADVLNTSGSLTPAGRLIVPLGGVNYFNTTGVAVVMASQSNGTTNLVAVPSVTALDANAYEFDNGGANDGSLRYTGATTKLAFITADICGTPATASDDFVFVICKNGTPISGAEIIKTFTATESVSLTCLASLADNDVITVKVGNTTAGRNLTVKALKIQALML